MRGRVLENRCRERNVQRGASTLTHLGLISVLALPAIAAFTVWGLSSEGVIAGHSSAAGAPALGSRAQAFGLGTAGKTSRAARRAADVAQAGRRSARAALKCTGSHCAPGSGMCFVAGTPVATENGLVAIEDVKLGAGVRTISTGAQDTALVAEDWVKLQIETQGTRITLLRPTNWVKSHGLVEGAAFDLALTEMGVTGSAQVRSIEDAAGPDAAGFAVTGLYKRIADDVYTLTIGGETLEPTGKHRFYSLDRDAWVATKDLLEGERLRTEEGEVVLDAIEKKPGIHQVYNLEVAHEHTYLVSPLRLYTHNQYTLINTRVKPTQINTTFDNVRQLVEQIDEKVNPKPIEVSDLTPEQLQQARQQRRTPEQYAAVLTASKTEDFDTALEATALELFGQSSGTELFVAGLRDIRNTIGEERFMEARVKAKSGKDYDSKLVTSLAYVARGDASKAKTLIAEAEKLSTSGERGIYRGLLRRLEVLADVFDDKVEEVPADVINQYFRSQGGPVADPLERVALGIGEPPDAETLRILDRFDGRRSRYRTERQGDELNNNTPEGSFLNSVFTQSYNTFTGLLTPSARDQARAILDAVRNRELDKALGKFREISSKAENYSGADSLERGQAIERLESAVQAAALRFRARDEPFTRRATASELDLAVSSSFLNQPQPFLQLANQLVRDLGAQGNNSRFFFPRDGVRRADLVQIMNDALRATVRGDVEGIAPRLDRFDRLLSDANRADTEALRKLLQADLEEYAELYLRGERRSAPPDLDPVDDRFRKRGAELADELSGAGRPSKGN